jgi:hypothetical protein
LSRSRLLPVKSAWRAKISKTRYSSAVEVEFRGSAPTDALAPARSSIRRQREHGFQRVVIDLPASGERKRGYEIIPGGNLVAGDPRLQKSRQSLGHRSMTSRRPINHNLKRLGIGRSHRLFAASSGARITRPELGIADQPPKINRLSRRASSTRANNDE